MPTLPQTLKKYSNYRTALSGKWHLGYAKASMTPTGKGFDEFVGCLSWGTEYFSKQMRVSPWSKPYIDWTQSTTEGVISHKANPMHATELITREAQAMITRHAQYNSNLKARDRNANLTALFLFVSYTAPHSPLQPEQHHLGQCQHISHPWRRQYCALAVGFDEGVGKVTRTALTKLGTNTIIVITSDNGGSPWFGGLNDPFRGAKSTPYEGGIHVPAVLIDYSVVGEGNTVTFDHIFHVSDWMPTMLGLAKVNHQNYPEGMDGIDASSVLFPHRFEAQSSFQAREEFLVDIFHSNIVKFGDDMMAYRYKDFKLIIGHCSDSHWYNEDVKANLLNTSDNTLVSLFFEIIIRGLEMVFDAAKFDNFKLRM
jgi:arylsulfatase A-like enzyme